jgi:succinate dehydrogenase flavin-adding protein (antitoxin of CptAB toxin-antitoxin module)
MKELDISLGRWAAENAKNLSLEDCRLFESQVLDMESPDIYQLVLKDKVDPELQSFLS